MYGPDDLSVDGARNAVLQLQVHLGDCVLLEDGGIADITCVAAERSASHLANRSEQHSTLNPPRFPFFYLHIFLLLSFPTTKFLSSS